MSIAGKHLRNSNAYALLSCAAPPFLPGCLLLTETSGDEIVEVNRILAESTRLEDVAGPSVVELPLDLSPLRKDHVEVVTPERRVKDAHKTPNTKLRMSCLGHRASITVQEKLSKEQLTYARAVRSCCILPSQALLTSEDVAIVCFGRSFR